MFTLLRSRRDANGIGATNRALLYRTARLQLMIGLPRAALSGNSRDWLASSHSSLHSRIDD